MRLTKDYESHSSQELFAEIEARRNERKNVAAANLFPGLTANTAQPSLVAALNADNEAQNKSAKPKIEPATPPTAGLPPEPAPAGPGEPVSAAQKAAAKKDDPSFKGMSEREAKHGHGGRLPAQSSQPAEPKK